LKPLFALKPSTRFILSEAEWTQRDNCAQDNGKNVLKILNKASEKSEAFLSFISKSSAILKLKINYILAKHFKY